MINTISLQNTTSLVPRFAPAAAAPHVPAPPASVSDSVTLSNARHTDERPKDKRASNAALGMGVMMGGMMVGASIGGGLGAGVMMMSMFGGIAIAVRD